MAAPGGSNNGRSQAQATPPAIEKPSATTSVRAYDRAIPLALQREKSQLRVRRVRMMTHRATWKALSRAEPHIVIPAPTLHPSKSDAISASGALNRPRRSSGGSTASTASSFSEASIRR